MGKRKLNEISKMGRAENKQKRIEAREVEVGESEHMELEYCNEKTIEEETSFRELLPIKTKHKLIPRVGPSRPALSKKLEENCEELDEDSLELDSEDEEVQGEAREEGATQKSITSAHLLSERQIFTNNTALKIASVCSRILEKPEEKIDNVKVLLDLMEEKNKEGFRNLPSMKRLTVLSVMEIFKDILPDYRVGVVDLERSTVKKNTLQRTKYENLLLKFYRIFLTGCEGLVMKIKNPQKCKAHDVGLAEIAVYALCQLVMEHPYFNFSQNIIQFLVGFIDFQNKNIRTTICNCFSTVFKKDKRMDLSQQLLQCLNENIKKQKCVQFEEPLLCLLSLPIKDINLDAEKMNELKKKSLEQKKSRVVNLSKRERKRRKNLVKLEKELMETKAEESKQEKNKKLVHIMKHLFTIYFRILKSQPNSKILSVALEGLAKFAHTINIDFFSDLVEVIYKILQNMHLGHREQLHCVQTVFTMLSGQGEVLNIDPARFYSYLYRSLLAVNSGQNHTDIESVLTSLENILMRRRKHITHERSMAFMKRLMTLSLQLLHNSALGCLAIVKTSIQCESRFDVLLDISAQIGSGSYNPNENNPDHSNAMNAQLWELSLLKHSYHPFVRKYVQSILKENQSHKNGAIPLDIENMTPIELFHKFDSTQIAFTPTIQPPNIKSKPKPVNHHFSLKEDLRKSFKIGLERGSAFASTGFHVCF